jgi:hypothetical protein
MCEVVCSTDLEGCGAEFHKYNNFKVGLVWMTIAVGGPRRRETSDMPSGASVTSWHQDRCPKGWLAVETSIGPEAVWKQGKRDTSTTGTTETPARTEKFASRDRKDARKQARRPAPSVCVRSVSITAGRLTTGVGAAMAASRLVLVDGTGFGWLEPGDQRTRGVGVVGRPNGTVACISCGGSLVKTGLAGVSILGLLKDALATGKTELASIPWDRPVCCRAVPARASVPNREYESLCRARAEWTIPEVGVPIMEAAGARYGGKTRTLHFEAEGMEEIAAAALRAFPPRDDNTLDVVLCCGWNCDGTSLPLECFAAKTLTAATTWRDLVREALTQAGAWDGGRTSRQGRGYGPYRHVERTEVACVGRGLQSC